jgi:NYN domain
MDDEARSQGGLAVLETVNGGGGTRTHGKAKRCSYPNRTLHLIDVENLVGSGVPRLWQVRKIHDAYAERVGFGALDQVVVACNHLALLNAGLGWPHARYRVRSGPDGADLELLHVLTHENVVERFTHFVIASGDGSFAPAAACLTASYRRVTVVSRVQRLSTRLKLAAHEVIYLESSGVDTPPRANQCSTGKRRMVAEGVLS